MNRARPIVALVLVGLVITAWAAPARAHHLAREPARIAPGPALTLGKITNNPRKILPALTAMGRYLAARLHDHGIVEAQVVLARTTQQMVGLLREGTVDLVIETPITAFALHERAGAAILLREWRDGAPTYRTFFFTRKDSGIRALDDLRGRTLACEDPGSTSAYFVPMATLRHAGLATRESAPDEPPSPDAVNYAFAGSELNIAAWVARGRADAGVVSNLDWDNPDKVPASLRHRLRVFHETEPVLRSLMLARGDLPAAFKARIKELLLGMHETREGREALAGLDIERYDEIVGPARRQLEHARSLYRETR